MKFHTARPPRAAPFNPRLLEELTAEAVASATSTSRAGRAIEAELAPIADLSSVKKV